MGRGFVNTDLCRGSDRIGLASGYKEIFHSGIVDPTTWGTGNKVLGRGLANGERVLGRGFWGVGRGLVNGEEGFGERDLGRGLVNEGL